MTALYVVLVTLFVLALAYAALLGVLVVAGRRDDAKAVARLVPDCVVLTRRLLADPRVPRSRRLMLGGLVVYLLSPIDLVPDALPGIGLLDDAVLVVVVLSSIVRAAGPLVIVDNWRGHPRGLQLLLRALG
jgi:uncharacterized membrane protein YkvA (DUF1232 family)